MGGFVVKFFFTSPLLREGGKLSVCGVFP